MNLLASAQYVKPYYIAELDCEGLTSEDIAKGLKAEHFHVSRKIRQFSERLQISIRQRMKVADAGRRQAIYLLPVDLAKMVVAKYDNEIGHAYLRWLLECEAAVPKLAAKIIEQQKEIELLQAKLKTKSSKPSKRGLIDIPLYESDLFGNPPPPVYIKVHKDSVPEVMQLQSAIRHTTHVIKGCVEKNEKRSKRVEEIICNVVSIVIRETDNARLPPTQASTEPYHITLLPKKAFTRDDAEARRQNRTWH